MTANESQCPIAEVLSGLGREDRSEMVAILDNGISSVAISIWAIEHGHKKCTVAAVNAHRKRLCECFA